MHSIGVVRSFSLGLLPLLLLMASPSAAQPQTVNWVTADQALGRAGTTQPDGVRRYGFPRSDLHVQLDGVAIRPALALGGWLPFQPMGANAVVMGDLVLTPEEVNPVMSELLSHGSFNRRHDQAAGGRDRPRGSPPGGHDAPKHNNRILVAGAGEQIHSS